MKITSFLVALIKKKLEIKMNSYFFIDWSIDFIDI